jgi:hypothetical protein
MARLPDTARRAQDSSPVRQHWEKDGHRPSPGTGRKNRRGGLFFRPVPGLPNAACPLPTAGAVGYYLSPFGLRRKRSARIWA